MHNSSAKNSSKADADFDPVEYVDLMIALRRGPLVVRNQNGEVGLLGAIRALVKGEGDGPIRYAGEVRQTKCD